MHPKPIPPTGIGGLEVHQGRPCPKDASERDVIQCLSAVHVVGLIRRDPAACSARRYDSAAANDVYHCALGVLIALR